MRFSVIVPVYGVEKLLPSCVESVLSQSFQSFELILVDDGSPDRSPVICDEYAKLDGRVHVIHQENQGVSTARNVGLAAAEGEYIFFLDGDDVLCTEVLARLVPYIDNHERPDIIIGNIFNWTPTGKKVLVNNARFINDAQGNILQLNQLYAQQNIMLPWQAFCSIYRRDFLNSHQLHFRPDLTAAEDIEFYLNVIQFVRTYALVDIPFVQYRVGRNGSITTNPNFQAVWGELHVFADAALQRAADFPDERLMRSYFADCFARRIIHIPKLQLINDRELCYQFVRTHQKILTYTSNRPMYIASKIVWSLMGYRLGSKIMSLIKDMIKSIGF